MLTLHLTPSTSEIFSPSNSAITSEPSTEELMMRQLRRADASPPPSIQSPPAPFSPRFPSPAISAARSKALQDSTNHREQEEAEPHEQEDEPHDHEEEPPRKKQVPARGASIDGEDMEDEAPAPTAPGSTTGKKKKDSGTAKEGQKKRRKRKKY